MKRPAASSADARPRVYLASTASGEVTYSFYPNGSRTRQPTIGAAVEDAIKHLGGVETVIFYQPGSASELLARHLGDE